VECCEINPLAAFMPRPPCHHAHAEKCRQSHVHGSSMSEPNNPGARGSNKRSIDLSAATKLSEEKIDCDDQQRRIKRRRNSRGNVTDTKYRIHNHRLPVIQRWLF